MRKYQGNNLQYEGSTNNLISKRWNIVIADLVDNKSEYAVSDFLNQATTPEKEIRVKNKIHLNKK